MLRLRTFALYCCCWITTTSTTIAPITTAQYCMRGRDISGEKIDNMEKTTESANTYVHFQRQLFARSERVKGTTTPCYHESIVSYTY
jgi:hypothetical protein